MRNAATAPTASQISCLCQIVATNVGTSVCPAEYSAARDRKSTRLNSSHSQISYAVFCLKKKTSPPPTPLTEPPAPPPPAPSSPYSSTTPPTPPSPRRPHLPHTLPPRPTRRAGPPAPKPT